MALERQEPEEGNLSPRKREEVEKKLQRKDKIEDSVLIK
ncbi:hypothetical protein E308F_28020 [Moorella sp. E308F]|nr:hypothetical protein E308F_28020 [Moorella sp. E308F]